MGSVLFGGYEDETEEDRQAARASTGGKRHSDKTVSTASERVNRERGREAAIEIRSGVGSGVCCTSCPCLISCPMRAPERSRPVGRVLVCPSVSRARAARLRSASAFSS